ncbi:hypothetical protein L1987_47932 [Smallanthus sonchifolius]|uniref:Uncharacterized protein n=1 Tax=Smallanthus sonchifolius TaxID=185202 RepID=A0ACB9FRF7_9ASTR|nr:hypothetical protein L1987_47932 [Smallanthus sonchifolius]
MAAPSFYSHWPTIHHNAAVPPPPELLPVHDNFTFSDTCINSPLSFNSNSYHHSSSFNNNNLQFHNPINYPTLSSNYNPLTTQQQLLPEPLPDFTQSFSFNHDYYSNPVVPDACDVGEFFSLNPVEPMQLCSQPECYSYPSYPVIPDVCYMEQVQPELPPLPEIYEGGGSSAVMLPSYGGGLGFNVIQGEERSVQMKENGDGCGRLSAQSMAARVRRRKISEKTSELGKLVPGGHRMTTAEMFQAAFKYIKFLQAQVGVLQHMPSSPGLGLELQALLTSTSVQEKLYAAGKCIVSQPLAETLADDHQGIKS